eukprot:CAMPEP_0194295434 /NCGR_PEP_ID=MMETSP0169-20130528/53458_1 /TAXON_ID=218684 /ORGANISM="Corethron pennatum, Strain L29A3" /LENGTH=88 /DNA_ID=CAMNT_0039044593 /DNA_START=63 /DNA_END=326 /DNA_ORIENTATION=-
MEHVDSAKNSTNDAYNRHTAAFESKRKLLDDAADRIRRGFSELEERRDLLAQETGIADVGDDDLLEINAGGQIVTATRRTLTGLPGTR